METFTENTIGYLINILTTIVVFNMMLGYQITLEDNLYAGVFFFLIAWVRKYFIRRAFSNWISRIYRNPEHKKGPA